jgi:hypothetical protein
MQEKSVRIQGIDACTSTARVDRGSLREREREREMRAVQEGSYSKPHNRHLLRSTYSKIPHPLFGDQIQHPAFRHSKCHLNMVCSSEKGRSDKAHIHAQSTLATPLLMLRTLRVDSEYFPRHIGSLAGRELFDIASGHWKGLCRGDRVLGIACPVKTFCGDHFDSPSYTSFGLFPQLIYEFITPGNQGRRLAPPRGGGCGGGRRRRIRREPFDRRAAVKGGPDPERRRRLVILLALLWQFTAALKCRQWQGRRI